MGDGEFMKFTMRRISNGWILKILNYGKSALKEPYPEYRQEMYFEHLEHAIKLIKEIQDAA